MKSNELLDDIRRKPYVYLHGEKSLKLLYVFVAGFEYGAASSGGKSSVFDEPRRFNSWVSEKLGFKEPTSGWCNMITSKTNSDEEAFDLFFKLLDEYKKSLCGKDLNSTRQP